ncbi:MAG: hypothetical protein R6X33_14085 [Candidatus Brocadiia bacterium]
MKEGRHIACIDLTGTILNHRHEKRPVPLMPELVDSMRDAGWKVIILTRWRESDARQLLQKAGLDWDVDIRGTNRKGKALREIGKETPDLQRLLFLDDKPKNLRAAVEACGHDERVRIMGFLGSRKYCVELSDCCVEMGIELALSAPDLAETIGISIGDRWRSADYRAGDWASAIPGLDHPFSAIAGETVFFDHRRPFERLRSMSDEWYTLAAPQLGWITCNECLWKGVVEVAVGAAGMNRESVLGDAYDHAEYTESLRRADESARKALEHTFRWSINQVLEGMECIGLAAELCRPEGRSMECDRLEKCLDRLSTIYPDADWPASVWRRLGTPATSPESSEV